MDLSHPHAYPASLVRWDITAPGAFELVSRCPTKSSNLLTPPPQREGCQLNLWQGTGCQSTGCQITGWQITGWQITGWQITGDSGGSRFWRSKKAPQQQQVSSLGSQSTSNEGVDWFAGL